MNDETYIGLLKKILKASGVGGVLYHFNEDIYSDFPTINIDGKPFERYKYLYKFMLGNLSLLLTIAESDEQKSNLKTLKKFIYELDAYGLDIHLTPEMTEEETTDAITKLDDEKTLFARTMSEAITTYKNRKEYLRFVLAFGRLCYRFNEYQAPRRLTYEEAVKDAMGLSDHYAELIDELSK